ncbi:hypothetical protein AAFF_G00080350 [Aldrovandia affinis]|uniref:Uncharacterized protein n=1 Tax=Aldrovandia affinis TaxID=143900 RepID=A0AAD7T375_9TELE|nr:hypothetical protein AAFF_G00080350 [Aldrovandia affinis]
MAQILVFSLNPRGHSHSAALMSERRWMPRSGGELRGTVSGGSGEERCIIAALAQDLSPLPVQPSRLLSSPPTPLSHAEAAGEESKRAALEGSRAANGPLRDPEGRGQGGVSMTAGQVGAPATCAVRHFLYDWQHS